jgi:hypothetical protein
MPDGQSIVIAPLGRLANQMFQLMLATELRRRIGRDIPILGYDIPEWGLAAPQADLPADSRVVALTGHRFNLDRVAAAIRLGVVDVVRIEGWGMRLEYYREPAEYAPMFTAPEVDFYRAGEDEIVLHVRGGDIVSGWHPAYFPLPIAYYKRVVAQAQRRPVFVGEIHDGFYGKLLRDSFPDARFLPAASAVSDFQTVRHARHVALSVSSFSWVAAWLSDSAASVHMPLCGIFDPLAVQMLIPLNDPRYCFYRVPFPAMKGRKQLDLAAWLRAEHAIEPWDRAPVAALVMRAMFADRAGAASGKREPGGRSTPSPG